jgi:hypothetical protein
MNHTNILTVGGGGAGAITAAQLSADLGGLAMYGLSCIDGACGFSAPADVVDMATRVVAVVAFGLVTVAGAALGRLVAHFIRPASDGITTEGTKA